MSLYTDPALPSGVVVTIPSPPNSPNECIQKHLHQHSSAGQTLFQVDTLKPPSTITAHDPNVSPQSHKTITFQDLLETTDLPEQGPALFAARRALWYARRTDIEAPETSHMNSTLEAVLNGDRALDSDEVWNAGLGRIWKGIVGGSRLKRRLPLNSVIKILQAGWVREGTWPRGGIAPDSDDDLQYQDTDVASAATSELTSRISSPIGQSIVDPNR
ncbi:hypothetical protein C8Q75DRAFT_802504 [Abortiporus biennis]|nr:hypothetical protein C8Q75DRAFT_802504 [Abortiporus biennis]